MIRTPLFLAASAVLLAACASAPETPKIPGGSDTTSAAAMPDSAFELAMQTVEGLVEAGNTQAALDRLTQLLGSPALTRDEYAEALFRRGEIRFDPQDMMQSVPSRTLRKSRIRMAIRPGIRQPCQCWILRAAR